MPVIILHMQESNPITRKGRGRHPALFETPRVTDQEAEVIERIVDLRRELRHQVSGHPRRWTGSLRRATFARALQGSNTIEGYTVDLADAMALAEGDEPLEAPEETRQAIAGYREAMTYVLILSDDPHFSYSDGLLRGLHFMMLQYDRSKDPGLWRTGPVYVHHEPTGQTVYEGPSADLVPHLMGELVAGLQMPDEGPGLVRAAMAHLNFVMIHPFRDGNGRMARILQSLVLARDGILAPEFASIEEYLGQRTQDYYDVLASVGGGHWQPQRDARPWLRFCLTAHFRQARTLSRRVAQAGRLWSILDDEVGRLGLPDRTVIALWDAAQRFRVRNSMYQEHADVSEYAGGRDLKRLVDVGLLEPRGEKRGRYYVASAQLTGMALPAMDVGSEWEREDPFEKP
jgi:Fic family protein